MSVGFVHTQSNVKTVIFQAIQFIISTHFSCIRAIDGTLSGATTAGQSGPGSDVNEGVVCILQSSHITGASPIDCLVSYPGHSLRSLTSPQRSSWCIQQPLPSEKLTFNTVRVNRRFFNCTLVTFLLEEKDTTFVHFSF